MKRIAVFMGAGASKAFGYPLTNELLPLIKERLSLGKLFDDAQEDRKEFSESINVLLPGFNSVDSEDLPLITDVLSLIDYSLHSSNSLTPLMTTQNLARFRILLDRAMLEVLDIKLLAHDCPESLRRLADWLIAQTKIKGQEVGIISTNYDIELETQLFTRYPNHLINTEFDFGLSWRDILTGVVHPRPADPSLQIYKLHGSLNWLRCDLCDHIYINTRGAIVDLGFAKMIHAGNTCHCGYAPLRSVIVSPSLVRDVRDVNLLECWKNATEFLRIATEWIIIGYSLPSEDVAIRSLFLRAYNARTPTPLIRVIQKGENKAVSSRYRLFFPNCVYETGGLEEFIYNEYRPTDA